MLSENALTVLQKRYLARDANGKVIETPDEMFYRVARHVASAEKPEDRAKYTDRFYQVMSDLEFLPNSPCLMNAGKPNGMLSACFVLPLEDSLDGIFGTLHEAMLVQARGGGCGYSLSGLRPDGDIVKTTGHATSGPISFLKVFDAAMEVVKQGGARNGANIAVMNVSHPDIEAFIDCKHVEGSVRNFNVSIAITDEFIEAVKRGDMFALRNPRDGVVMKSVNAKKLWRRIAEGAWRNGEPGILMIDEINRKNPVPSRPITATNPCGEISLPPYDSCNLGSINLNSVIFWNNEEAFIGYDKLKKLTHLAVRFLDNVIEVNNYPIPAITKTTREARRIGLGIMGLADVLMLRGKRYDSKEGRGEATTIMSTIQTEAHQASTDLAKERGSFPLIEQSIYKEWKHHRNATLTTIAPTGSISILANCSSGCEPHFALANERHVLNGTKLIEVNDAFMDLASRRGFWTPELAQQIMDNKGHVKGLASVPDDIQALICLSSEIDAMDHVRMQAALQLYVDNNISKTINAHHDLTVEEVETVLMAACEAGCHGMTFYREGSRSEEVLIKAKKEEPKVALEVSTPKPPTRAKVMYGTTHKVRTGYGTIFVTVNRDKPNGIPQEVFVATNHAGSELRAWSEFASRISSMALRHGMPPEILIKCGRHIRGAKPILDGGKTVYSGPDAVAQVLEQELAIKAEDSKDDMCPECHNGMVREEGCLKCPSCSYSQCGG